MGHDWALILYTLCIQAAVGIYVVSRFVVAKETQPTERTRYLTLVLALGVAGVLGSTLHLGSPAGALLTMSNLGSSWLSREILFTILFGVAGICSLVLELKSIGTAEGRNGWAVVTGLLGVALVVVMSMIYRSMAFPSWTHFSTTTGFLATAGLIGTVAVFAAESLRGKAEGCSVTATVVGAAAMLALQMVSVVSHLVYLGSAGKQAQMTAAMLSGDLSVFLWARVLLVVVGAAICVPWAWKQPAVKKAVPVAAIALVGLGELVGRVLFYATRVKIGL
ncbi:MAG TPA: DmsC/YnfH family molybdoenzyme membrane anchor subunit [Symbiobacteriaceae bacterium]|nr:DmsC/YnfH family molybdoenzyme membrane anchor subunit [Symbiobacteriaceae bacterium]